MVFITAPRKSIVLLGACATLALATTSGCGSTIPAVKPASTGAASSSLTAQQETLPSAVLRAKLTGKLPAPVQLPAVAANGAGLFAIGGLNSGDASVSTIVSVSDETSRNAGSLPSAFHDAGATTVAGSTYVFGGGEGGVTRSQILRLSGDGSGATQVGVLPTGSSDCEAVTIGLTAYVVGGYDGTQGISAIIAYTPGKTARTVGHLPVPLRYAAVAAIDGKILVAGGTSGTTVESGIYSFNPATGKTTKLGKLAKPVTHAAGAALNGRFYVIGGRSDSTTSQVSSIVAIDPSSGKASNGGRLPTAISDMGAARVGKHIVAVGGKDSRGTVHSGVLELAP